MKPRYHVMRASDGKWANRETLAQCNAFVRGQGGIVHDRRQHPGRFHWSQIGPRGKLTGLIRKPIPPPRIR